MSFESIIQIIGKKPYYSDDAAVIYCADNRDILPSIPDKSVDLVLTDPPYGIGMDSELHNKKGKNGYKDYGDTHWDIKPTKDVFDAIMQASMNQIIWGGITLRNFYHPRWDGLFGIKGKGILV